MGIPTIGLVSPFVVTGGYGLATDRPGGGFRFGGHAYNSEMITGSGGLKFVGTSVAPRTFLAALVSLLRTNAPLVSTIGQRIYATWPGTKAVLPLVLIEDFIEGQPGEELENNLYTLTLCVYASHATEAMTVGRLVQNAVDTPAQNNKSTREPLYWVNGRETDSWRDPTLPPTRLHKTAFGRELYRWSVQYTFHFLPFFQV